MATSYRQASVHSIAGPGSVAPRWERNLQGNLAQYPAAKRRRLGPQGSQHAVCSSTSDPAPDASSFSDSKAAKMLARYGRSQQAVKRGLPSVDWHRYHLQILFVDRACMVTAKIRQQAGGRTLTIVLTDTVRARMAAGLLERVAEWNGLGRALYPQTCGVAVPEDDAVDPSTSMTLMTQAGRLKIRTKLFAAPRERLVREDLDRCDMVVAMDADVRADILRLAGPEFQQYYARKVAVLTDFSGYCGPDLLRRGGTAVLEPDLSSLVESNVEQACGAEGIKRPSLQEGPDAWNLMVRAVIVGCAGLTQYCGDSWPPDLPDFDPV